MSNPPRLDASTAEVVAFVIGQGYQPCQPVEIDIDDKRAIVTLRRQSLLWPCTVAFVSRTPSGELHCDVRRILRYEDRKGA